MERYVLFDDLNTYTDFGFILTEKTINPPEPKTNYVEIDGADGAIDLTEALTGEVRYRNRSVMFTFWTNEGSYHDRVNIVKLFRYKVHGRKMKIIDPDDSSVYLMGRVIITEEMHSLAYSTVSMECICDPYRNSIDYITISKVISENDPNHIDFTITYNGYKPVIPEMTIHTPKDKQVGVSFNPTGIDSTGNIIYKNGLVVYNGTFTKSDPNFKLYRGENIIGLDAEYPSSILFKFREVSL